MKTFLSIMSSISAAASVICLLISKTPTNYIGGFILLLTAIILHLMIVKQ